MGCNNSKQPQSSDGIDVSNGEVDDNEPTEVEAIPQNQNAVDLNPIRSTNKKTFMGMSLAVVSARRAKLRKLPKHVAEKFARHEHSELSTLFVLHASTPVNDQVEDGAEAAVEEEDVDPANIALSVIGLSKAFDLPHEHIHTTTNIQEQPDDLFARQLHRYFAGSNGHVEFNDFAKHVLNLMSSDKQQLTDTLYNLFNLSEHEEGILLNDMVNMTISMLHMACNDRSFDDELDSVGLDWVHCSVVNEETLNAIVKEWVREVFFTTIEKNKEGTHNDDDEEVRHGGGVSGRGIVAKKTCISREEFQLWFCGLSNLQGNNMFARRKTITVPVTPTLPTPTPTPKSLRRRKPPTPIDVDHDDLENNQQLGQKNIDSIDWTEGADSSSSGDEDDEIQLSQGGTGYI